MKKDTLEQVKDWANKGFFIDYTIIDQDVNGYGGDVAEGLMEPITYTVTVATNEWDVIHTIAGFESPKEALEDGIKFVEKNFD